MPETQTKPGTSFAITKSANAATKSATPTMGSYLVNFSSVRHTLSDAPLRRPNRIRPSER